MQLGNRITDVENKFMVTRGERGGQDKVRDLGLTRIIDN